VTTVVLALGPGVAPERLVTLVARAGASPVAVTSDADAFAAQLSDAPPDVALVDLELTRTEPQQMAAIVAAHPHVPVVGLCCGQAPAEMAQALAIGVSGFIAHDCDPKEMAAVLRTAVAGHSAVSGPLLDLLLAGAAEQLRDRVIGTVDRGERVEQMRALLATPAALVPVFQPIADLRSPRQFGWLALTRFAGTPPAETGARFAEARELGLAAELELAAAAAALAQADRLPAPALLFVKASGSTIASHGLDQLLDDAFAPRLVIEMTGVGEIPDREGFNAAVDRLRHRGVRFAVDETGAGFGRLDEVLDLSPAFVRLAGGLTRGIDADRTRRALALTVISFASHLGARVIADQIETADELDALRRLGVGYGLGFHIGRPQVLPERTPTTAAAVPTTADEPDPDAPLEDRPRLPVQWARSNPRQDLGLSARARASFEDASAGMLKLLGQRLPDTTSYVALLDPQGAALRIVDAAPAEGSGLDVGTWFPLDESLDELAATGRVAQLMASGAVTVPAPATGWAVVPFAGTPERPLATLTTLTTTGELDDAALDLLRDAAGVLGGVLHHEYGEDVERLAAALRELSGRDRFTGLLNAHRFREVLEAANARAVARGGLTFVVAVNVSNLDALAERMGQTVGGLVLKDVARSLALEADHVDAVGRVGPTTYGCVLFGRRASEIDYFCSSVTDRVAGLARRRGATVEMRTGVERLGLRPSSEDTWQAAVDRLFA
jgi:EAL domain-containing protein (putative c-di-GMP-specific phosphodiesterase class I)/GGDEF domain-containing protein/AmiR/NasT family two-component response regulator